jgi:hypothetical protein
MINRRATIYFRNSCDTQRDQRPSRHAVTCELGGKPYRGIYWIACKILTDSAGMAGKSKYVGTTPAENLAKRLVPNTW